MVRRADLSRYRAAQVWGWLFENRASQFDEMTDLPKALRGRLAEEFQIWTTRVEAHPIAADGTEKLLLSLGDGNRIECVLLRDDKQNRTVCISTQVGCAMGCVFCASGLDGVARNLTTGEILEEMLQLARLLPAEERINHIVVMGMGEPLANLDRLLPALKVASVPYGLGIGARRITISTVGIPKAIRRLADENRQYHLAVSLHAPDDELAQPAGADQSQGGHRRDPRSGRLLLRQDRPPADLRVRALRRTERPARARPQAGWRCLRAGRP